MFYLLHILFAIISVRLPLSLQCLIGACIPHRLARSPTCASHQTFMQVNQADLKTFSETISKYVFFQSDAYPILTDSGVSDIEQTPCWSELLKSKQERACRTDTHHSLMRTSCWEDGSPWRPDVGILAGVQRRCVLPLVKEELFVWIMLLSGRKHAGACLTGSSRLQWFSSHSHWWKSGNQKPGVRRVDGSNHQTVYDSRGFPPTIIYSHVYPQAIKWINKVLY